MVNRKKLRNKEGKIIKRPKAEDIKQEMELISKEFEGIEGEVVDYGVYNLDRFGRPTVMTPQVLAKIVVAFKLGCTHAEAARAAKISDRTLDKYFLKDPEFKEYCKEIRDHPTLTARKTLVKALETNAFFALQYLERKLPNEFGRRVRHTVDVPEELTPEEWAEFDDLVDENF